MSTHKVRIVCISDTHNQTPKLPAGDVLIHAGDLTNQGSYTELKKTVEWLEKSDFQAKIVVAGNLPSPIGTHNSLVTCADV
jgi:3',5'-cyclic AMP phosphodiesterase CpdA